MVHHNNCPLCKAAETNPFLTCTDNLVSREKFHLFKCTRCSFIFTNDYPGESDSALYYESDEYISHTDSQKLLFEKIYRQARNIMLGRKRKVVSKASGLTAGNILDIGCGTGHFLNEMKQSGWKTTGVEINRKAREYASENFNLNVIPPSEIISLPDRTFDSVTLWHALEHLHDPYEWFGAIKRLLKTGGKVIVALPNCLSFDAAHYGSEWAAWDVPRHLWHFSPETFDLFIRKAGFKTTGMKVLPFDVYYISILSEKHKGSSFPEMKGILTGFLYSLLSFFRPGRSSSLIYLLESASD